MAQAMAARARPSAAKDIVDQLQALIAARGLTWPKKPRMVIFSGRMSAKRRYLASVLDRLGLSRAVLAARARDVYPWRWLTVVTYHRVADATARGFDPDVVDASPGGLRAPADAC